MVLCGGNKEDTIVFNSPEDLEKKLPKKDGKKGQVWRALFSKGSTGKERDGPGDKYKRKGWREIRPKYRYDMKLPFAKINRFSLPR